jgi:AP-3 complex subunit beta
MAQKNQHIFQTHQKSFYVHANDSIQVKILKLEILTCLANESNISAILREFQTYVLSNDKEFAAATIHAIGRCASTIKEVSDNCLSGLVNLMSKKDGNAELIDSVIYKFLFINYLRNHCGRECCSYQKTTAAQCNLKLYLTVPLSFKLTFFLRLCYGYN